MNISPLHFTNVSDALALITQFNSIADEPYFFGLLNYFCRSIGVDYFHLGFISPNSLAMRSFSNAPFEWVQAYNEQELVNVDPIVRKCIEYSTPILWMNIITECFDQQDCDGLDVMMLAKKSGLRDGITLPWHGPHGHIGLLSLMTQSRCTEYQWISCIPFLSWLVLHLFDAVTRIDDSVFFTHEPLNLQRLGRTYYSFLTPLIMEF